MTHRTTPVEERTFHGGLRRRRRPGHHQHPIHDLRPRGNEVARHQLEHEQILPQAGWVEHNPVEIWERTVVGHPDRAATRPTCSAVATWPRSASPTSARPPWCGTARPGARTTTRSSGRTPAPTGSPPRSTATAAATSSGARPGLPPATYFSGGKIQWILENVDGVREAAERGDAIFGNTDTLAALEPDRRRRRRRRTSPTPTNASRTMLMDLETLDWDDELLGFFDIPRAMLPRDPAVVRPGRVRHDAGRTGRSAARCRSPATSATSRRPPSARSASRPARPRTPTAPATSCC